MTGLDRSGVVVPVAGATVHVGGAVVSGPATYTFDDERVTSDQGAVTLDLLGGGGLAAAARLAITPPAGSALGVLFDQRLPAGAPLRLPSRVALSGRVIDAQGRRLGNVAVTARPSLRFLWSLEAAPQAFVSTIPAATAVTSDDGAFLLWVDPAVGPVFGGYDLLIEPPTQAQAPASVLGDIAIPQSTVTSRCQGTGSSSQLTDASTSEVSGPCSAPGRSVKISRNHRPSHSC